MSWIYLFMYVKSTTKDPRATLYTVGRVHRRDTKHTQVYKIRKST